MAECDGLVARLREWQECDGAPLYENEKDLAALRRVLGDAIERIEGDAQTIAQAISEAHRRDVEERDLRERLRRAEADLADFRAVHRGQP